MITKFNKKLVKLCFYLILSTVCGGLPFIFPEWIALLGAENYSSSVPGDLDCDDKVTLTDAILALKVQTSIQTPIKFCLSDVNKDGKVGLEEEIYILQIVAGLRSSSGQTDIYATARQQCVAKINAYRATLSLAPLQQWTAGESCADNQAQIDSNNSDTPHYAFLNVDSCMAWAQNECPGWSSTDSIISGCLAMMWAEGPGSDFNTHGHYINMSNPQYTQVACGFYKTSSGAIWSVQDFR